MIWALATIAGLFAFWLWALCRVAADSDKWYEDHR